MRKQRFSFLWLWAVLFSFLLTNSINTSAFAATQISGGEYHSIFLKSDGIVWACGGNDSGQLGNGATLPGPDILTPAPVLGLPYISAVAAGGFHSLFLAWDGTVWACGANGNGQLGNGSNTNSSTPVQVSGLSGVIAIAGGYYHSLALKSDGTVWAWGHGLYGQLGQGLDTEGFPVDMDINTPVQVKGIGGVGFLNNIFAIASGADHCLALGSNESVYAWGRNIAGQVGDGTTTNKYTPVEVTEVSTAIAGRGWHSLALKGGTVEAWGANQYGQLGDGTTLDRHTPVLVSNLSNVIEIACGGGHSVARKSDFSVWAWGYNASGQLGVGIIEDEAAPVQVLGSGGFGFLSVDSAIAGGGLHTLAANIDGTVWAWGDNSHGQLGDGTNTNRETPVQSLIILYEPPPEPPPEPSCGLVADAGGDQSVNRSDIVTLDGSNSSDLYENPLTYNWEFTSKPTGSTATLSGSTTVSPTFTVDKAGTYVLSMTVDNTICSASDSVTISTLNVAPTANAGPDQSLTVVGTTTQLNGSGYDPDGDPITFLWYFTSTPGGSEATLQGDTTGTPTFVADVRGNYVIQLIVSDPWLQSEPDEVLVSFDNIQPVANAGASQAVTVNTPVTLDGSGSVDADGNPLSYAWSFTSRPAGSESVITNPTAGTTTFVPDKVGTYVVQLVVNDGTLDSLPDTTQVEAITVSAIPQETAAIEDLLEAQDLIASYPDEVFATPDARQILLNKYNAAIGNISKGNRLAALNQLQHDIIPKIDICCEMTITDIGGSVTIQGSGGGGGGGKGDLIIEEAASQEVYTVTEDAVNELAAVSSPGYLKGYIKDAVTGAAISGASLVAKISTTIKGNATSSTTGAYALQLNAGTYSLTVTKTGSGYLGKQITGIAVYSGSTTNLTVKLSK